MATVLNGHLIGSTGRYWWSEELVSDHTIIFNRKKGILDEVRHYAADIIAMQEVSPSIIVSLPDLNLGGN